MTVSSEKVPVNVMILAPKLIQGLSSPRLDIGAAANGSYVYFAGGCTAKTGSAAYSSVVDAYTAQYTRVSTTALSRAFGGYAGAGNATHFMVAGHFSGGTAEVYSNSNSRTTTTALSVTRSKLQGGGNADYLIFAGGTSQQSYPLDTVDAYNNSNARSTATSLTAAVRAPGGGALGGKILVAGGNASSGNVTTAQTYSTSLAKGVAGALSVAKYYMESATTNTHILLVGNYSNVSRNVVDAYTSSFSRTTAQATGINFRGYGFGAGAGSYAIFGGGHSGTSYETACYAYDQNLSRSIAPNVGSGRMTMFDPVTSSKGCSASGFGSAFFGGGMNASGALSDMDVYDDKLNHQYAK